MKPFFREHQEMKIAGKVVQLSNRLVLSITKHLIKKIISQGIEFYYIPVMTKIEELSELLVSEIKEFQETVKKLEEIRKSKIQLDLQNLSYLLTEHRKAITRGIDVNERFLEKTEKLNNQTRGYLRKGFILVAVGFFLNLLSIAVILYLKVL